MRTAAAEAGETAKVSEWSLPTDGFAIQNDPKNELVSFAQKHCGRSMGPGDIAYTVQPFEGQHQAVVKIICFEPHEEYAGELMAAPKDAEQSAAKQALLAHKAEVAAVQVAKRKKAEEDADQAAKRARGEVVDGEDPAARRKLNSAIKQLLGRDCEHADSLYELAHLADETVQATLTLPTLSAAIPAVEGQQFVGEPSTSKHGSRLKAAMQAVAWIVATPEGADVDLTEATLAATVPVKPKVSKPAGATGDQAQKSKGKGKGKWKGQMMQQMMQMMSMAKGKGKGWGSGGWGGWGGGGGWNAGGW